MDATAVAAVVVDVIGAVTAARAGVRATRTSSTPIPAMKSLRPTAAVTAPAVSIAAKADPTAVDAAGAAVVADAPEATKAVAAVALIAARVPKANRAAARSDSR